MDGVCDESEAARPAASSIAVSVSVILTYKPVKADTDYGCNDEVGGKVQDI
jgi:hypothetical protein